MEPWTDPHGIWNTQSAFFSFLRGQLRRSWTHYPVAKSFKSSQCRPNRAGGRAKFVGDCAVCNRTLAKSHLQIDHIRPAGSIVSWETAGLFLKGLFTTSDNMRLVCKPCHHTITQMERYSLSEEEVKIKNQVILFTKKAPTAQIRILTDHGCPDPHLSNAAKRRSAYHCFLASGAFAAAKRQAGDAAPDAAGGEHQHPQR